MKHALRYILKSKYAKFMSIMLVVAAVVLIPMGMNAAGEPRDCWANDGHNAILDCGAYSMGEVRQKAGPDAGAKALYARYGVNINDDNVVNGQVGNDDKVYVNGQVVAVGAITVGRQNLGQSTPWNGFWERPPHVSFRSPRLDAFVKLNADGQFQWAIIKSCGNPVRALAMPVKKPHITITKTVNVKQIQVGKNFTYTITIKNDGEVDLTDVVIGDVLPKGIVPVNHPATDAPGKPGQKKVTWNVGNLPVGKTVTKQLVVTSTQTVAIDKVLVNTACVITNKNPGLPICDTANVVIRKKPVPPVVQQEPPVETPPVEEQPPVEEVKGGEALPNTGAGEVFLGITSSGALGAAINAYFRSRKGLAGIIGR